MMKGWLNMKFVITLEENQMDHVEGLVGSFVGGTYIEKLLRSNFLKDDGSSGVLIHLCCTGTFGDYLRDRKFYGKNQVHKLNW